ncbi:hypothetical protein [Clostridium estertheticum]|uniref:hypothetical protein n=1 Tax=Clostridium estertheticum TaxID=238834 RepID=UPI001C6F360D|nr:hypothetical protein [Clostridium estertheticum]MBW9154489.1 hypothetical protein [Clostridium estertheticum]WLC86459.1 hypothetical protein KTC97_21475 [Clostridium estertheticum]
MKLRPNLSSSFIIIVSPVLTISFNGLIMVLIEVMLLLNIIDRSYIGILYSIPALILVIGTSISKKCLVEKHRWIGNMLFNAIF